MKKNILMVISILLVFTFIGCKSGDSGSDSKSTNSDSNKGAEEVSEPLKDLVSVPQDDVVKSTDKLPVVTIKVKNYGTMEIELYPDIAPNTVANFIELINSKYYDGLTFHRIIKDFMVQGGDPQGNGQGGPGYSIKGEFENNGFENKLLHKVGVISMARALEPNSAGSQFFIVTKDSPHLDGNYAAFGRTISGLDVLTKLNDVKTLEGDKPENDIIIEYMTVDTKGIDYNSFEKIK